MHDLADKAGRAYWDRVWHGRPIPGAVNPQVKTWRNHVERSFHQYFKQLFDGSNPEGGELLEIGAARSSWLPYFAKEFGFQVSGIDYSEEGCEQARAILDNEGVGGRIILADFSDPPADMLGEFDVVVSFGVIEHFADTVDCVAHLARFLKPGGEIVSVIPNMVGSAGWIEKRTCRSIYDVHVPLNRKSLRQAHERAGLTVLSCRYFMGGGYSSLNFSCWSGHRLYPVIRRIPLVLSMPFWFLDRIRASIKPNRLTSPYLICRARKESGR